MPLTLRWILIVALGTSCTGEIETASPAGPALPPSPEDPQHPAAPPPGEEPIGPKVFLPAGIRRLSKSEVEAAATALLGLPAAALAEALGSDTRQSGFTRNSNQRVDATQADALWTVAATLARLAVTQRLSALAPCAAAAGSEACAVTFIRDFSGRAFRRVPTAAEQTALLAVYRSGAQDSTWAQGIELVITAVLQSGAFLYVTELGAASTAGTVRLTGEELATQLALLFTGAPADAALLASGRTGALDLAAGRDAAARTLLATPAGRAQVERLVLEWVGADGVESAVKDPALFPQWLGGVGRDMLTESRAIVNAVVFQGDGTLGTLLSTNTTVVSPSLGTFYGLPASGQVTQPASRRGLLLAGAFLSASAHPSDTGPMKRAATVRRKLLCQELPLPTNLTTPIVVPPTDPSKTTRERFSSHSASAACASCHNLLDPIAFALETFDPVGRVRTTENGKPIDPSGTLLAAGDATGPFADAAGLVSRLAHSRSVATCFQRQLFRFATGREASEEERTFIEGIRDRPSAREARVADLLVDYAQSDSFVIRRLQ